VADRGFQHVPKKRQEREVGSRLSVAFFKIRSRASLE